MQGLWWHMQAVNQLPSPMKTPKLLFVVMVVLAALFFGSCADQSGRVEVLEAQLEEAQTECVELRSAIEDLEGQVQDLQSRVEDLEAAVDDLTIQGEDF